MEIILAFYFICYLYFLSVHTGLKSYDYDYEICFYSCLYKFTEQYKFYD